MEIDTTRFGKLKIDAADLLEFPNGILGLEACRDWVLLADADNDALGWLQSTTRGEIALAVVSPRRFVPDYQIRIPRSELAPLRLASAEGAKVLVAVSKNDGAITVNLRAPLVINLDQRLGRQIITTSDHPLQYAIGQTAMRPALKKSA